MSNHDYSNQVNNLDYVWLVWDSCSLNSTEIRATDECRSLGGLISCSYSDRIAPLQSKNLGFEQLLKVYRTGREYGFKIVLMILGSTESHDPLG